MPLKAMGMPSLEPLRSLLKRSLHCRMCRRIGAYVVLSILAIEGAILIPSYWNYERDLLLRLESTGRAELLATYRNAWNVRESNYLTLGYPYVMDWIVAIKEVCIVTLSFTLAPLLSYFS